MFIILFSFSGFPAFFFRLSFFSFPPPSCESDRIRIPQSHAMQPKSDAAVFFFASSSDPPFHAGLETEKRHKKKQSSFPPKKRSKQKRTDAKKEEGNEYFMVAEPNLFALFVRLFFSERNIRGQRSGVKNIYFSPLNYSRTAINTVQPYLARETVFWNRPSVV